VAVIALAGLGAWIGFKIYRLDQHVSAPEIALRGRNESAPPQAPQVNEDVAALSPDLLAARADGAVTQVVPIKDCLALIYDTGAATGVEPTIMEQTAERTVARLGFEGGGVTITCAGGTMTIEQNNAE
jgi:hypothetical protein